MLHGDDNGVLALKRGREEVVVGATAVDFNFGNFITCAFNLHIEHGIAIAEALDAHCLGEAGGDKRVELYSTRLEFHSGKHTENHCHIAGAAPQLCIAIDGSAAIIAGGSHKQLLVCAK